MAAVSEVMQTPSDRVLVGLGCPMFLKRLVDKTLRWEFINLAELLPPTSVHDTSVAEPSELVFPFFWGVSFSSQEEMNRHYHRMGKSIHT